MSRGMMIVEIHTLDESDERELLDHIARRLCVTSVTRIDQREPVTILGTTI